ncbi:peroxiredoxin family protein [Fulvivirgaceae bacterium BMA10]|uniref:Peroxiredoxin family protein n=1 Tax=Splendidivirga corallicola TaxID=3051826 RepID=A0ABT8KXZ7_9BACT|nr:peroxiredoxin family protein [Fulvivirgaceae bacterium BMA10]
MKQINFLIPSLIILIASCTEDPQKTFNQAQKKIQHSTNLKYSQLALYPNPMGKVDTLTTIIVLNKAGDNSSNYDFIIQSGNLDDINIGGNFKSVNHKDGVVKFFPKIDADKEKYFISNNRNIKYSPITLLNQTSWKFAKDTLIDGRKHANYFQIENDTIINGNKVYTEVHIFINRTSKLIESLERRNYFKGKHAQTVTFQYSDYDISNNNTKLAYDLPSNYKSIPFGRASEKTLLSAGQKAPDFTRNDIKNKPFNLDDYRGKKVLLNFSTINCGYCKIALDHFNREDYKLSNKISGIYINPLDEQAAVIDYIDKINVPFRILADAKDIGDLYGVSAYPTFFLIDEYGVIEKVVLGYQKDFLESLRM